MNYWAFVAKPGICRIEDAVQEIEQDTWRVGKNKVSAGDLAIIWKSKGKCEVRGIVAFAGSGSGLVVLCEST